MGSALDIANRGQIRFYRKSATTCAVKLTISYELPDALAPFGSVRPHAPPARLTIVQLAVLTGCTVQHLSAWPVTVLILQLFIYCAV